ncbi:PEP-CTERM sorting domain-containing protein [Permianibacter sp. IMCC34836]|uniref:choice-of-anchor N protein n=1 Tax=Permianibacter fluminis TaxID=2738515 RepID=UPI001554C140|nr:choice-of-anchor N protein [Permianibacter fluminis]NQD35461.1 PEP-CTERM sorting domain-containing protein [Permianibacter fluminis]
MLFPNIKKWIFALALSAAPAVHALPVLQLYVEGGTYDVASETWVVTENDFTVWVIGNTGQRGTITGANGLGGVSLVVSTQGGDLANLSITPTLAGCCDVVDPSLAGNPIATLSGTGHHSVLADHGIFNQPGIAWQQFDLGVFALTDSLIGDATQGAWPVDVDGNFHGQINAYHVTMLGDFDFLHFDGFGYTNDGRRYVFAPFSHDAEALPPPPHIEVPVPATLSLFSLGAFLLARRRK